MPLSISAQVLTSPQGIDGLHWMNQAINKPGFLTVSQNWIHVAGNLVTYEEWCTNILCYFVKSYQPFSVKIFDQWKCMQLQANTLPFMNLLFCADVNWNWWQHIQHSHILIYCCFLIIAYYKASYFIQIWLVIYYPHISSNRTGSHFIYVNAV